MARSKTVLLVGTRKGLLVFTSSDRKRWELNGGISLQGKEINHAMQDPRTGIVYATLNDPWFGGEVVRSEDLGRTWISSNRNPAFSPESGLVVERLWHIEPGPESQPGVLYAGVAPAALFKSEDGGETWLEVRGLTQHPSRSTWHAGGGGLILHTILVDPMNPLRILVGVSAGGVYGTDDGGSSWSPLNRGIRTEELPDRYPESGQCVHKIVMAPDNPGALFAQGHWGSYRSQDGGQTWQEITAGLPSDFGFAMAIHPRDGETIYVVPLQSDDFRCPPEGNLQAFRSQDAGRSWKALSNGLPQENAFMGVYRECLATDTLEPVGVYFGANTGKIFFSIDEGDTWDILADNLPPVTSVSLGTAD